MLRCPPPPIASLLFALVAMGCAHKLTGPNHGADAPPWIAAEASHEVPAVDVQHRVLLIGDAGYFLEDDPTLKALGRWAGAVPESTVVLLGDNVYDSGLENDDRERGEKILAQQLAATSSPTIVIPGNHDWGMMQRDPNGKSIRNQQEFVDAWPAGSAHFIPRDGCMGPAARVLTAGDDARKAVVFIALDPTPWINEKLRVACSTPETHEGVLADLDALLSEHRDDWVVVGSHYPMITGGPHGGLSYGFPAEMIVTPISTLR